MASGKYPLRSLSALALLCVSTAAYSTDSRTEALPCPAPVVTMTDQSEPAFALGPDAANDSPLSPPTTSPRAGLVLMPELLTREAMAALSESELHDRIASIERTISSLFERLPTLLPAPSLTQNEAGCQ